MKTNTSKNKPETTATETLATINAQIEALKQQRVGLSEPLKGRYAELRTELLETETQIRELDPTWKPEPLKPKAEAKIREILGASPEPLDEDAILKAVGDMFTKWKVRTTLKKRFTIGTDGKYSVAKAA